MKISDQEQMALERLETGSTRDDINVALSLCQRGINASKRLELAKGAIVNDGFFEGHEIDDDIAPRIVELLEHRREQVEKLRCDNGASLERIAEKDADLELLREGVKSRSKQLLECEQGQRQLQAQLAACMDNRNTLQENLVVVGNKLQVAEMRLGYRADEVRNLKGALDYLRKEVKEADGLLKARVVAQGIIGDSEDKDVITAEKRPGEADFHAMTANWVPPLTADEIEKVRMLIDMKTPLWPEKHPAEPGEVWHNLDSARLHEVVLGLLPSMARTLAMRVSNDHWRTADGGYLIAYPILWTEIPAIPSQEFISGLTQKG